MVYQEETLFAADEGGCEEEAETVYITSAGMMWNDVVILT